MSTIDSTPHVAAPISRLSARNSNDLIQKEVYQEYRTQMDSIGSKSDKQPVTNIHEFATTAYKASSAAQQNLMLAEKSLKHIRNKIYKKNYKSYNKSYVSESPKHQKVEDRRKLADGELTKTRTALNNGAGYGISYYSRAHNCAELAEATVYYLSRKGVTALKAHSSTHSFAVIGAGDFSNLPVDIRLWSNDIAVCDPWANIACPIGEYTARFSEKMTKWAIDGKLIPWNIKGDWKHVPADQSSWVNSVVGSRVKIHIDSPRGRC